MAGSRKRKSEVTNTDIKTFFSKDPKQQFVKKDDENASQESDKSDSHQQNRNVRKPLGLKNNDNNKKVLNIRQPLREKTTQSSPIIMDPTMVKPPTRQFNVLCDDDIKKGLKQAHEPKLLEVPDEKEIDTQNISDIPNSTQSTDDSPIPFSEDGDPQGSSRPSPTRQLDEQLTDFDKEDSRLIQSKKTDEKEIKDDEDEFEGDLITKTIHKENVVKPVLIKKETKEEFKPAFDFADNEEQDFFNSESSSGLAGHFFDDVEEESDESKYVDPEIEFSISESINPHLDDSSLTLSPTIAGNIKEFHVPFENPRGENVVQKLGLDNVEEK